MSELGRCDVCRNILLIDELTAGRCSDCKQKEHNVVRDALSEAERHEVEALRWALREVDVYLAELGWWHVSNIAKAGQVIGDAIGWDEVARVNTAHAPRWVYPEPSLSPRMDEQSE
jgi:hypothetical protein